MNDEKKSSLRKGLFIALAIMIVLLVGWYLVFPALGIAVAMTAAAWGIIVATVIVLAVGILTFYIFAGVGIIVVSILGVLWFIAALVLFPFLFPFLLPLLIILLFIAFARRKESKKSID